MDLSKFQTTPKVEEGIDMPVFSPVDGEPLVDEATKEPVTIRVIGQDSKAFASVRRRLIDARLNQRSLRGRATMNASELEKNSFELIVACTKDWKHIAFGGSEIPCTPENVRKLYEALPWLAEQVSTFTADRANFLGN